MKKLTAWMGAVACATLVGCGGGGGSSFDYRTLTAAELQRAFFNSYFATSTVPPSITLQANGSGTEHCSNVTSANMQVDASELVANGFTQLTFALIPSSGQNAGADCMSALFPQWAPQGGSASGTMQYDFTVTGGVIQQFTDALSDITGADLKGSRLHNYYLAWQNATVFPVGATTVIVTNRTSAGTQVGTQAVSYTLSSSGELVVKTVTSDWTRSNAYPVTFTEEDTYQISGSAGNYSVTLKKITATGTDTGISPVTSTITLTTP